MQCGSKLGSLSVNTPVHASSFRKRKEAIYKYNLSRKLTYGHDGVEVMSTKIRLARFFFFGNSQGQKCGNSKQDLQDGGGFLRIRERYLCAMTNEPNTKRVCPHKII